MAKSLERSLGFWSVLSVSIGAMVGSGIFVLPGLATGKAGPIAIFAYFVAGLMVLPAALSQSELATAIPATGGAYVYLDRSMGPFIGTIGGIGTWFSLTFKSAFALVGLGAYLTIFLAWPTKYVALVLCLALVAVNIAGAKKTARLLMIILAVVFIALFLLLGRGVTQLRAVYYTPFVTHGLHGLIQATGFVFISYAGVTKIASIVGEVKQPERNVPLGILLSLAIMTLIYTLMMVVLVGTQPVDALKKDLTPIASAAGVLFGPMGRYIWAFVAVLALTSMANAGILSSSRFPYAMSRDSLLPRFLRYAHPRLHTPVPSILLTGSLMLLLIAFVDVERLAKLASAFQIVVFCLVNLSVIIFRESNAEWYRPRFRSPGYPWVQLLGMLLPLGLIPYMGALPMIGIAGIFASGAVWYLIYARHHADRLGALAQTREQARQLRAVATTPRVREAGKAILVPFFGNEPEAEIESRIRIAMIFSLPEGVVHPVHFEEVPDETLVEALRDARKEAEPFEQRFERATQQWAQNLTLDSVATHDAKLAAFRYAESLQARWILMGHQRRSFWNALIRAHKYWWLHHSPSNVTQFLHRDLREIQRIAVMTEPGPYDGLLVHVADRLATVFDAETCLFHVAKQSDPESEIERVRRYHDELRTFFRREVVSRIVRGKDRLTEAIRSTADFDLLILGAPAEDSLLQAFTRSFEDRLAQGAHCSVFLVQSPRGYSHEVVTAIPEQIRSEGFRLFPFMHQRVVQANVDVKDKAALFRHLSRRFAEATEATTAQTLGDAFWQREGTQNTAMGHGVAMPHAVIPDIQHTLLGVFTLQKPIDFDSPDGSEVDICFVTIGPSDQRSIHLKTLGRVAYLIRETDLITQMRAATEDKQLVQTLVALDSQDI